MPSVYPRDERCIYNDKGSTKSILIHQPNETKSQTLSAHLLQQATKTSIMNVIFLPAERSFCNDLNPCQPTWCFKPAHIKLELLQVNLLNLISRVTILSVQTSKLQPTLQLHPQKLLGFGRTLIVFYVIFFKVDERQWSDRRCCACSS